MTAFACLRVGVDVNATGLPGEILARLVAKYTVIYLESRWPKPRSFEALDTYTYLLADPGAEAFDQDEIQSLSDQLRAKLFGSGSGGEVALLLFEGGEAATRQFAGLGADRLAAALDDPTLLPAGGRLTRIVSGSAAASATPETDSLPSSAPEARRGVRASHDTDLIESVQGLYFLPRQLFIGDVISATPAASRRRLSILSGPENMPADAAAFDAAGVIAAVRHLIEGARATLFLPISFSNIVRASERESYRNILSVLPSAHRNQLSAIVYDTPRDPTFSAVSQIHTSLGEYFANIHLQTNDPSFEVEKLQDQAVCGVTFALPAGDARSRLLALQRFAARVGLYRRKQIWCGVTDLRSRAELDACISAKIALVTGDAICGAEARLTGGRRLPSSQLPIRSTRPDVPINYPSEQRAG